MHTYGTIDFSQTDLSKQPSKSVIPVLPLLSKFNQYNVTKLANILFSHELHHRRLTANDITTVSLHPVCLYHHLLALLSSSNSWYGVVW
jgi:NAD(P)-dependent dehydrogenase (short-subunit alcohol dehydrogenase family)